MANAQTDLRRCVADTRDFLAKDATYGSRSTDDKFAQILENQLVIMKALLMERWGDDK